MPRSLGGNAAGSLTRYLPLRPGRVRVKSKRGERRVLAERNYILEIDQEIDGRWIAEIHSLPGVMAYGATEQEAIANAEALAFRVIADQIEQSKIATSRVSFATT